MDNKNKLDKFIYSTFTIGAVSAGVVVTFTFTYSFPQMLVAAVFFGLFAGVFAAQNARLRKRIQKLEDEKNKQNKDV